MEGATLSFVIPNPDACGIGKGARCCIFLTASSEGFTCEQRTNLRQKLIDLRPDMRAQRMPEGPYPNCQTEGLPSA